MKELEQQYTFAQWLLQDEWLCNECLAHLRPDPRLLRGWMS